MSIDVLAPVQGSKWLRSNAVTIRNEYGLAPTIIFEQEVMATFTDGTIKSLGGTHSISESFTNPTEEFNLLNSSDGTIIGTSTYQNVYILLASLYAHIANK